MLSPRRSSLRPRVVLLIGGVLGVTLSLSYLGGFFYGTEHFFEDLLASKKPLDSRIVILSIDDESIEKFGQWPWPRATFGRIFDRLNAASPAAVGFDVVLSEPSRYGRGDDAALQTALTRVSYPLMFPAEGTTLRKTGSSYEADKVTLPLPEFRKNGKVTLGHVNLILDPDGVVRRLPIFILGEDREYAAMSVLLAEEAGAAFPEGKVLPIVYAAPPGGIPRIPIHRVASEDLSERLKGKIVLIGATAPDLHDEKPTPLSGGAEMPGVEIQANSLNMLLMGYRQAPLPPPIQVTLIFLLIAFPLFFFQRMRSYKRPLVASLLVGLVATVMILMLYEAGIGANLIHLSASWMISTVAAFGYRYVAGEREKKEMRDVFSKYVSGAVLDKIMADPTHLRLGGERKIVTVLFSDIRGFTTLSERLSPEELVRVLNRYFTAMTGEILKQDGVLDKYIGDAIMAFWGAPLDDPSHADHALKAAEGMLLRLKELNTELKKSDGIEIHIGIGLYSGPAVVGNIGSDQRFDYTAMGDTVNVASRLEGLTKEYGVELIVGASTKDASKETREFRHLGDAQVKGRAEAISIWTLAA